MEAEALIQVLGGRVGCADFQASRLGTSVLEFRQNVLGEAGSEAAAAEIGMHGKGIEAAGATAGGVAPQQADGPAGNPALFAG